MKNINEYLKENFDSLPISHQNFIKASVNTTSKGPKKVGKDLSKRYRLTYLNFQSFYKPITSYLL